MLIGAIAFAACNPVNPPVGPQGPGNGQGGNKDTAVVTPGAPDTIGWNIPAECLTVAEANAICAQLESGATTGTKYYVKGWVKKLASKHEEGVTKYNNAVFYIEDVKGANSQEDFEAYQVYGPNGSKITSLDQVLVGDYVVLYGKLTNYNGTYETVGRGTAHIWKSTNPLITNNGGNNNGGDEGGETPNPGDVTGAGTYHYGETTIITATPNTGYNFLQWSDGDTHTSRQIVVTNNITLVAFFTAQQFDLILTSEDPAMGYVIGEGKYDYATELTIQAIPYKGYQFLQWSNGITDNPYTFVLTEHTTLVASFIEDRPTAISNTPSPITNCQKIIYNAQLLIIRDGKTYNAMGQEM